MRKLKLRERGQITGQGSRISKWQRQGLSRGLIPFPVLCPPPSHCSWTEEKDTKKNAKNRAAHSWSSFVPVRKDAPFWAAVALQVLGLASSVPTFLLGQKLLARTKSECGSPGTGRNR